MTALAANRLNTNGVAPFPGITGLVAANVHLFQNALIACVNGYWQPATAASGLQLAICMREVDNTSGLAGAKTVEVEFIEPKRLWLAKVDVGSPILQANIGGEGWIIDDCTVSATGAIGTHSKVIPWQFYEANRVYATDRVWVEVL